MKIFIIGISFLIFSVSLYSQDDHTDVKEFGLKGNVKSVESNYYLAKEYQETWILDSLKSRSVMDFNKKGNFTKIISIDFPDSESEIIEFQRDENGRKISYKKHTLYGIFETGNYEWISEKRYRLKAKDSFGVRMESEFTLTENFRDESGTTIYYDDKTGEYLLTFTYQNILDKNGNLLRTNIFYEPSGDSSTTIYDVQEIDAFGNWIKVGLYHEEKDFREIMIRNIEYY